MKRLAVLTFALLSLSACKETHTTTVAHSSDINGVVTSNAISLTGYAMRPALGNNTSTAAYVTVANTGNTPDRLVSASCACAASVTLHTMTMANGMMSMAEQKDGFAIAAGQTLVFAPGGNHIMLEGLTAKPQEGGHQAVTLHFEKAGDITVTMPVTNTIPAADHSGMAGMKM